jgi:hypothetical protein
MGAAGVCILLGAETRHILIHLFDGCRSHQGMRRTIDTQTTGSRVYAKNGNAMYERQEMKSDGDARNNLGNSG